jgi:hypothetical protein
MKMLTNDYILSKLLNAQDAWENGQDAMDMEYVGIVISNLIKELQEQN